MALQTEFVPVPLETLHDECKKLIDDGWRFVQMHCVNAEANGIDVYYSFMKGNLLRNLKTAGVKENDEVQSVTDLCLGAFVFENEARELFGVNMQNIAIDFGGNMYTLAEEKPMTFISPETKAEKDKAKKLALAKEAKMRKAREEAAAKAAAAAEAPAQDAPAKEGE